MKKLVFFLAVSLVMTSCASHFGAISTGTLNGNVIYQDVAIGTAQTSKVLGIGGLGQDALVFEAKRDLMRSKPLKQGEQLTNFTVDFKHSYWLLYFKTVVVVTADVVTVNPDPTGAVYSDNYLKAISSQKMVESFFEVGDSVMLANGVRASIVSIESKNKLQVSCKSDKGDFKTKQLGVNKVFSTTKEKGEYKAGRFYTTSKPAIVGGDGKTESFRIAGVGAQKLLLHTVGNELIAVWY